MAVSSDLYLTADLDADHSGVLLKANFADQIWRTNYAPNPRFAVNTTNWVASSFGDPVLSRVSTGGPTGSAAFGRITWGSASGVVFGGFQTPVDPAITCAPGERFAGSVWVRCSKAQRVFVRIAYNYGTEEVPIEDYADSTAVVLVANTWTQVSIDAATVAPADTISARVIISSTTGTGGVQWVAADTLDVTLLLLEKGSTAGTYFDGATSGLWDYRFTGTAHNSASEEFSPGLEDLPFQVRFERDGIPVRSGNPAWSPGGYAVAYDHEAPLGTTPSWKAIPLYRDGSEGDPSQAVLLPVPSLTGTLVWIKSLEDPGLSLRVQGVKPLPTFSRQARMATHQVAGSKYPGASLDVRSARTGDLTVLTYTDEEAEALEVLTEQFYFLVQFPEGIRQFYCLIGDLSEGMFRLAEGARVWTLPLVETGRPVTTDAPLIIPGRSYDEHRLFGGTYTARTAAWETYDHHLPVSGTSGLIDETGGGFDEGSL